MGDNYEGKAHLLTILPSGVIENDKELIPAKEGALIAYPYPQDIPEAKAQQHLNTPFVWKRTDGTHAVVQTWPVKYNEKFHEGFGVVFENPDVNKFKPKAVSEFKEVMIKLFGATAQNQAVIYAHKETKNELPVYIGSSKKLADLLSASEQLRKELNIAKLLDDGFVSNWVDGKQKTGEKEFHWPKEEVDYALYTKQGWETMACITPLEQFKRDRDLTGSPVQP